MAKNIIYKPGQHLPAPVTANTKAGTAVRIGATSVSNIEVLEGLQPGDRIVIAGTDAFEDAERIAIND